MKRNIKLIISITSIIILLIAGLYPRQKFDKECFNEEFSDFDIELFSSVGFHNYAIKWNSDIRVQILYEEDIKTELIAFVDTVISDIQPLIYPLKIEKVKTGGNFIFHFKKEFDKNISGTLSNGISISPTPVGLGAYTSYKTNIWGYINKVEISILPSYENGHQKLNIVHETLHGVGLAHLDNPRIVDYFFSNKTLLDMVICPVTELYSQEVANNYWDYGYIDYLPTDLDKKMVRMLYSDCIKIGMKKRIF
jgi:hypothetical protein